MTNDFSKGTNRTLGHIGGVIGIVLVFGWWYGLMTGSLAVSMNKGLLISWPVSALLVSAALIIVSAVRNQSGGGSHLSGLCSEFCTINGIKTGTFALKMVGEA